MMATKSVYAGLFVIALATLMYEILITRIFSVTTWYHFAFLAISLAMLGMTAGAIIVYLSPHRFISEKTNYYAAISALSFGLVSIIAVLLHVITPSFLPIGDARTLMVSSLIIAVPLLLAAFICSGVCISLTLTRFPEQLHKLYATDLIGAALGCIMVVLSLQVLDGITDVFFIGSLGCLSAVCFSIGTKERWLKLSTIIATSLLAIFVCVNGYLYQHEKQLFRLSWSKGEHESNVLYERWNCFSRIVVQGVPDQWRPLEEFGLGKGVDKAIARYVKLNMDGYAATPIYKFDGKFSDLEFLQHDLSALAHHVKKNANVLVIGVGGNKDIIAALAMNQESVTGVEINDNIIKIVNGTFGDYGGHIDKSPRVELFNDEARSFITRSNKKYDIILASLVDTWAASSSGAYALTENSLYTVDGWKIFIDHLTDQGILSMSRWYNRHVPAEIYRLVVVASEALKQTGVQNPLDHIVLVRHMTTVAWQPDGLGTILVKKSPFTPQELDGIEKICRDEGFELVLSPRGAVDPNLKLAASGATEQLADNVPFDMSAATDDRPFFFQNLSLKHIFDPRVYEEARNANNVMSAVALLMSMVAVTFFSFYCVRLPFLMTKDKSVLKGTTPLFVYFFAVGVGFMLIEMSQIQRFSILLGHPIYAISVTLFTLLLATGVGSLLFGSLWAAVKEKPRTILLILLAVAGASALVAPLLAPAFSAAATPVRIAVAVVSLFPLGMVLGLAFPLGMKLAFRQSSKVAPWLWGINGAASVCGSVMATLVSMFVGISASYWLGFVFYLVALLAVAKPPEDSPRVVT